MRSPQTETIAEERGTFPDETHSHSLCGLLLLFSLSAAENGEEKFPTISAEAEVETFVRADMCHVLFLLKGGKDMQSARSDFETRKKAFTEKI